MDVWELDETWYRVPNEDMADVVNTLQKMAYKRALVAATLLAINASEFFTQDVEDMDLIDAQWVAGAHGNGSAAPRKGDGPAAQAGEDADGEDAQFFAEWDAIADEKELPRKTARGILGAVLRKRKLEWERTTPEQRRKLLEDFRGATPEQLAKLKAAGNGGPAAPASKGSETPAKSAAAAAAAAPTSAAQDKTDSADDDDEGGGSAEDAGTNAGGDGDDAESEVTQELVRDWEDFKVEFVESAVRRGADAGVALKSIEKAVVLLGKKGKETTVTLAKRIELLNAVRGGYFDFESGRPNQVAQATA
jgi:hypothetical protein